MSTDRKKDKGEGSGNAKGLGNLFQKILKEKTPSLKIKDIKEKGVTGLMDEIMNTKDLLVSIPKIVKDELEKNIQKEIQKILGKIDFTKLPQKILENYHLEVKAQVHFKKNKNEDQDNSDDDGSL